MHTRWAADWISTCFLRPLGRTELAYGVETGAGAETLQFDALGRPVNHASDLGSFTLSYLGQTGQITQRQLISSNLATSWSYLANSGDRRLASISNTGLAISQFSNFQFTTTPENFISAATQTSDIPSTYPVAGQQSATYNNLNQLTNLSGQALTYDATGNLLSDGQRNYAWDAENRLISINYPALPGKLTTFTYDGLGRRTAITSTPSGGGSAVTTSYIWCGARLCQARRGGNAPTRSYYDEGEFVPGAPAQTYYYGPDHIGSPRRVFASATSAPAFDYDPYGVPLQGTAPLTDFGYAGMFYNADSGLYLTLYRAYDPVAGRWLSRDPMGEVGDPTVGAALSTIVPNVVSSATALGSGGTDLYYNQARYYSSPLGPFVSKDPIGLEGGINLYGYVNQSPTRFTDPYGERINPQTLRAVIRFCWWVLQQYFGGDIQVPPDNPKPQIEEQQPPARDRKEKPGIRPLPRRR